MAYQSCTASIGANIQPDCNAPLAGGYTGRAILIPLSPAPTIVYNATNALQIESVTKASGQSFVAIENFGEQPFSGTNSASDGDGGVIRHTKSFSFDIPKRGATASKQIVDPLTRLPRGFMIIAERRQLNGDAGYIVLGAEQGLRVNADGVTSDEYTKDGATTIVCSCRQYNYEYSFFSTDAATTAAAFEQMLAQDTI